MSSVNQKILGIALQMEIESREHAKSMASKRLQIEKLLGETATSPSSTRKGKLERQAELNAHIEKYKARFLKMVQKENCGIEQR